MFGIAVICAWRIEELIFAAVIHRADRLPPIVRDTIRETMPNRIAFFEALMPADMPLFTNP